MKIEVICPERIEVFNSIPRHEIVRVVVNKFIDFEHNKKEKGKVFKYKVETLHKNNFLYIVRPGHKKNFDFKVEVEQEFGLNKGTHLDIAKIFTDMKTDEKIFSDTLISLSLIYHCIENDVDKILKKFPHLKNSYSGTTPEIILKVVKWLFIMEDIVYWDNKGREFLYNYLIYVIRTGNLVDIKNPTELVKYLKKSNIQWEPCKG